MKPRDDPKATQKLTDYPPRKGPAQSPFAGGKAELLSNPAFKAFREILMKNPKDAADWMRKSPECVDFAARMLSDEDLAVSIEAGVSLRYAAEMGIPILSAMGELKRALLYSENDHVRLFVVQIFHRLALDGNDISDAHMVLQSAYEKDSHESVRLTAENALIAADLPPQ